MRALRILLGILLPAPITAILILGPLSVSGMEFSLEYASHLGSGILGFAFLAFIFIGFQAFLASLLLEIFGVILVQKYQSKTLYVSLSGLLGALVGLTLVLFGSLLFILLGVVVGILVGLVLCQTFQVETLNNQTSKSAGKD